MYGQDYGSGLNDCAQGLVFCGSQGSPCTIKPCSSRLRTGLTLLGSVGTGSAVMPARRSAR